MPGVTLGSFLCLLWHRLIDLCAVWEPGVFSPCADGSRASAGVSRSRPHEAEKVRVGPGLSLSWRVRWERTLSPPRRLFTWPQEYSRTPSFLLPRPLEARGQLQSHSPDEARLSRRACCLAGAVSWSEFLSLSLLSTLIEALETSVVTDPQPFAWASTPWELPNDSSGIWGTV